VFIDPRRILIYGCPTSLIVVKKKTIKTSGSSNSFLEKMFFIDLNFKKISKKDVKLLYISCLDTASSLLRIVSLFFFAFYASIFVFCVQRGFNKFL